MVMVSKVQGSTHTVDRLSNLPFDIIESILRRIPIKDVVRTCVLSRQWRYNWVKLSTLVFEDSCGVESGDVLYDRDRFASFIYKFLLAHCGPIHTFKINTSLDLSFFNTDMDEWLQYVTRDDIKEVTLRRYTESKYQVPFCLFSCEQLKHLFMNDIILQVPDDFRGFRNLVSLQLHNFDTIDTTDGQALESLLSNCLVLERLELDYFRMVAPIDIQAPKLKYLYLHGDFGGVILQNSPLLEDITLIHCSTSYIRDDREGHRMTCDLVKSLCLLSGLKSLKISAKILKNLHLWHVSDTLLIPFNHLEVLEINSVSLQKRGQITATFTLLKMFSRIPKLSITVRHDAPAGGDIDSVDALNQPGFQMQALKSMKIKLILNDEIPDVELYWYHGLRFIKYILAYSPLLEKMTLECDECAMGYERMFMKELLHLKRTWKRVKFSFYFFPLL